MLGQRQHIDIELEDEPVYQKFCAKIAEMADTVWKINPDSGGIDNRTVRMTAGAKAAWVALYNKLEIAAGPGGKLLYLSYIRIACKRKYDQARLDKAKCPTPVPTGT